MASSNMVKLVQHKLANSEEPFCDFTWNGSGSSITSKVVSDKEDKWNTAGHLQPGDTGPIKTGKHTVLLMITSSYQTETRDLDVSFTANT